MSTPDVYLKDALAESLAAHPGTSPVARELLAMLRDGWGRADGKRPRAAVRGLTGSARAYLVSWLQRELDRTVLYVVRHGETWESARDEITSRPRCMSSLRSVGRGSRVSRSARLVATDLIGASELFNSCPSTRSNRCQARRQGHQRI